MKIPNMPSQFQPLINKNGYMDDQWYHFFDDLMGIMNSSFSQGGIEVPAHPSSDVKLLETEKNKIKLL
jgi:hypothetical protein